MPSIKPNFTPRKLVLGEGLEEVRVFTAMLKHLGIRDITVEHYGGKDNLSRFLENLLARANFAQLVSLGITRDADASGEDAFRSVCGALEKAGLPKPSEPGVIADGKPKVTVLVLPDGKAQGMLEDVCLGSVAGDGAVKCLDAFFECVEVEANRKPVQMSKARVHAWLATQTEPDKRLGEAAECGFWDWGHAAFEPLKRFLQEI